VWFSGLLLHIFNQSAKFAACIAIVLFECTRLGMMLTQLESKTISLDDKLSVLQGIVKIVGFIYLADVPGLSSVLTLIMTVKNYHVIEENENLCVCVCVCVCTTGRC
jgi:hypothetical protein